MCGYGSSYLLFCYNQKVYILVIPIDMCIMYQTTIANESDMFALGNTSNATYISISDYCILTIGDYVIVSRNYYQSGNIITILHGNQIIGAYTTIDVCVYDNGNVSLSGNYNPDLL